MYEEKTQRLLERLQYISDRLKGREFNFYPTNAINKGIVNTPQEYDICINNLIQSGELVKTRTAGNTNYYQIPNYKLPSTPRQQAPVETSGTSQQQVTIKTLQPYYFGIQPFDYSKWLSKLDVMEPDGNKIPFYEKYPDVKSQLPQVQEFFKTQTVVYVENETFQEFLNNNREVYRECARLNGVVATHTYLHIWFEKELQYYFV